MEKIFGQLTSAPLNELVPYAHESNGLNGRNFENDGLRNGKKVKSFLATKMVML